MTVKEKLLKTGTKMSKFDQALFIWRNKGYLQGLIVCLIDDFIYGASVHVLLKQEVINKIEEYLR